MGASKLLTVLFGDLVGSTERLAALGAAGPLDQVDALNRFSTAVEAHGGRVVKTLGDGVMATFDSPRHALDAAVAIQQTAARLPRVGVEPPAATVGIASGEAIEQDGDWAGLPVVEAARLCGAASPGQILASDLVLALARPEQEVASVGLLDLKGLPEPVAASEVRWSAAEDSRRVLPPALVAAGLPFGGRSEPMQQLRARWDAAVKGEGGLVLIAGEPGVGKTRLVSEFAAAVLAEGAVVTFGRSDDMSALELQPFVEALRYLVSIHPPEPVPSGLGWLLPEVPLDRPEQVDAHTAQVELLDGVCQTLRGVAAEAPLLVVLDDVHWAAEASLAVLRHVMAELGTAPVLLVATYRDTDVDRVRPLGAFLSELRGAGVERIGLTGLQDDEMVELVTAASGHELAAEGEQLAHLIGQATGGNAFFVGEMLAHLVESGALVQNDGTWSLTEDLDVLGLPQGVRDVVGQRLRRLPEGSDTVLAAGAVVGRSFPVTLLAEVTGLSTDEVLDALEQADGARLIAEDPEVPGSYMFAHALVRQVLLDELSAVRRARLHEQIGEALARRAGDDAEKAGEAALHLLEAAPLGTIDRAVAEALRSLDLHDADGRGRPDVALGLIHAVEAVAADTPPTVNEQWGQLLQIGATASFLNGDRTGVGRYAEQALAVAEVTGSAEVFAGSVSIGVQGEGFAGDPRFVSRIPEALERVDPTHPYRLILLGQQLLLGALVADGTDPVTRRAEMLRSLAEVRAGADQADPGIRRVFQNSLDLAAAGMQWSFLCDADVAAMAAAPAAVTDIDLGDRGGLIELTQFYAAVRSGDLAEARARADDLAAGGVALGSPVARAGAAQNLATLALLAGRLDEVEPLISLLEETVPDEPMYMAGCSMQRAWLAHEDGRYDDATRYAEDVSAVMPYPGPMAAYQALLRFDAGQEGDARRLFDEAWADGPATLGWDWTRPGALHALAELAAAFGEAERAAEVEPLLAPFAGQLILFACTHVPGSASATLGRLALVRGDQAEGRRLLEEALAFEEEIGAPLLAARTRATLDTLS